MSKRKGRNVHVVPAGRRGRFVAKVARGRLLTRTPVTQGDAIERAMCEAKELESEVVIHRPDGRIRDSDSYGPDPESVKDTKH
jgi:hypothetical protein